MNYKKAFTLFTVVLLAFMIQACAPSTPAGITVPTPAENNAPVQPPTAQPPTVEPVTVVAATTAVFDAGNSGSLCPKRSPELALGSAPPIIGEIGDEYRCEGYWTFIIPELPSKSKILSATFSPGACTMVGNPFAYGPLYFEYAAVGEIDVTDYGRGDGSYQSEYAECPASIDVTAYVRTGLRSGSLQIFAAFYASDYGNGTGDYISYQANMPTLTIEYSYTQ
ncbi:MAG: hypothetical protein GXP40_10570 [Chloroflexi bacterium]|nr:hypothetical protein [Chloroflexota bacterium]